MKKFSFIESKFLPWDSWSADMIITGIIEIFNMTPRLPGPRILEKKEVQFNIWRIKCTVLGDDVLGGVLFVYFIPQEDTVSGNIRILNENSLDHYLLAEITARWRRDKLVTIRVSIIPLKNNSVGILIYGIAQFLSDEMEKVSQCLNSSSVQSSFSLFGKDYNRFNSIKDCTGFSGENQRVC